VGWRALQGWRRRSAWTVGTCRYSSPHHIARHIIQRILNPRCLSFTSSSDVAGNNYRALAGGVLEQALLQAQRAAALAKVHLGAGSHVAGRLLRTTPGHLHVPAHLHAVQQPAHHRTLSTDVESTVN
jgi:hypothetical protein